jgi:hypothetical protein
MSSHFNTTGMPGDKSLYNKGFRLEITHLPTDYSVAFPAFLDDLSDAYSSEWSESIPYGRMDPIGTFVGTRRAISVSWRVVAASAEQANENLQKINKVVSFLYPLYTISGASQASTIAMGPYWKIKFGNLICNSLTGEALLGWVNGITVDPVFEEGIFTDKGWLPANNPGGRRHKYEFYPQTIRLNVEMTVLHEHSVGWKRNKSSEGSANTFIFRGSHGKSRGGESFPYPSSRNVSSPISEQRVLKDPSVPVGPTAREQGRQLIQRNANDNQEESNTHEILQAQTKKES